MADNTVADLPKKNAAPAEPAKSLAATVQQVISKAVTSPTDAKIDFAQGVNHITGDPHQKSAGQADAMQSLKAGYMKSEMEPKEDDKSEAYEEADKEKKEKEDVKEAEMKKDDEKMMKASYDKKKEDMKEGEMPAGLKKYLDKKNGKEDEKSEEKEDEKKKDMKEAEDKEKEMKKEMSDDEKKKKEMSEAEDKEDKKKDEAVHDKEDKKKEMSEAEMKKDDEKEMKKEMSAKDKVKDMDMKEDVNALTEGEDLSEEFKAKAATIFESAVKAKLVEEIENLESEYEAKVAEKVEETKSEIVEKVDAYLNYVVEEWMKENELAIEKGLRNEITEDFIGGLKSLFESHYIDVPQEKFDVIENQAAEIEKLKEEVNQTIEKNVELNQQIGQFAREDIINDVSSDLAITESEKLKGLAESIEYKDAASFRTSVETLKNSYFPKTKASDNESNEVAENNAGSDMNLSESMAAYTAAISKTKKNPYLK